ncbi:endonuclease/exonuclease/phosphatase family protein [Persicitalea jodogahamensis]|uniref:Endonuclease n=1 Tax=Persicitalea jodogahamensis TaxID=402147 RepID=A0A8J3GAH4_9BACT|nr:endonuclease/exonuclease/phosphatase family protein [Persicitalea jodogahamensis]GHB73191.1 endonuclease [Persicitalea jodogahamensis]
MRLFSGLLWSLYKIAVLYTLLIYALTYWIPSAHWVAGFLMLSLPVMLVFHTAFLLVWALLAPKRLVTTLFVLIVGYPFLARTFQFRRTSDEPSLPSEISTREPLTVLNYNVFSFGLYDYQYGNNKETVKKFGTWISEQNADVLCLQEYFDHEGMADFNFTEKLQRKGYKYHSFLRKLSQGETSRSGMAVFSKYPIVAIRDTLFSGQNGLLQADIAWQGDTVSVIDVHLYSMTLQLSAIVNKDDYEKSKHEAKYAYKQMRKGFEKRGEEVKLLKSWIDDTPHPTIVCGDFNETPYSYVYGSLRKYLANAFEQKGSGFGFTYNHLPYFIRIDNQFYDSNKLELLDFNTLNQVPYSDHYPLIGRYLVK